MKEEDQPTVTQESKLDTLIQRVGAWHIELLSTRDNIQEIVSNPAATLLLDNPGAVIKHSQYTQNPAVKRTGFPRELEECTTQEQVAEYLASSNNGLANLKEAAPLIRQLGLSNAVSDQGLQRNMSTRLVESGRWVRAGPSKIRSVIWKPPVDGEDLAEDDRREPERETPN